MRLDLAEYETVADAAPVIGDGEVVDPGTADVAPADTAAAEPAADTAAVNPFEGIDVDALRALAELAPHLLNPQAPQPQPQGQQDTQGPPDFDPFDPDSLGNRLEWERKQTLDAIAEMVNPLASRAQAEEAAQQQELLADAAHDIEVKKGEFIGDENAQKFARAQVVAQARELMPQYAARYGMTDRAAEMALEAAYDNVKAIFDAVAGHGESRYKNSLATLAGANAEPGTGAGAVRGTGDAESVEAALARWKSGRDAEAA